MHEGNLLALLPAFNTKWLSYTIELVLDEACVRACNNFTKNSKCHLKLANMWAQEKTSFPVKARQTFTPQACYLSCSWTVSFFIRAPVVKVLLCIICHWIIYIKSHSSLLLMETVSTGERVPALMVAGFAVEQLAVLASSILFCLKTHWKKYSIRSYAFCICKPHVFVWNERKCHLAHESFV